MAASASGAADELARELGGAPPPELNALADEELGRLVELLRTARVQQSSALGEAIDDGLRFVPRLLRGTVKRALFG
jgi:hypothetical protein